MGEQQQHLQQHLISFGGRGSPIPTSINELLLLGRQVFVRLEMNVSQSGNELTQFLF